MPSRRAGPLRWWRCRVRVTASYLLMRRARGQWGRPRLQAAASPWPAAWCWRRCLVLDCGPLDSGTVGFTGDLEVYTWSPLNFARREFVTVDGRLSYRLPNGVYYGLSPAHPYYFTPLLALAAAAGVVAGPTPPAGTGMDAAAGLARDDLGFPRRRALAKFSDLRWRRCRPWRCWRRLARRRSRRGLGPRCRWLLPVVVLPGLAWMALGGWQLSRQFIERKQADLAIGGGGRGAGAVPGAAADLQPHADFRHLQPPGDLRALGAGPPRNWRTWRPKSGRCCC